MRECCYIIIALLFISCTKGISNIPSPGGTTDTLVLIPPITPVDLAIVSIVGFFLNDWNSKIFAIPTFTDVPMPAVSGVTVSVNPSSIVTKIALSIFGNNVNPYMTQMVSDPTLLNHKKFTSPYYYSVSGRQFKQCIFLECG